MTLCLVAATLLAAPVTPASAACPSSSSTYRTMMLGTAGLAAYWRLDEGSGTDACDSRGANTGQYGGGSQLAQSGALTGDSNTAVALDGLTGRVTVPSALPLNPSSAVSVEAWVRPSVLSTSQTIVRKDQQYLLRLEGGKIYARVWLAGGAYAQVSTSAAVQAGAWQHIVATFDGSALRVYRNGTQLAVVAAAGSLQSSTNELALGRSSSSYDYFSGRIDEAAIYSRALPASEVRAHHDQGAGTDTAPPETTITSGPGSGSNSSNATFAFGSSEPAPTFDCRLDGGAWASCESPKTFTALEEGRHAFEVRARDVAGNVDASPADYSWVVEPSALYRPATLHSDGADLQWGAYRGTAFAAYEIHRSSAAGFTPTSDTLLARIPDQGVTTFRDTTAAPGKTFTYKLLVNGIASGEHTAALPADGQAEKTLQPNAANGAATWIRSGSCDNNGRRADLRAGVSSGTDAALRGLVSFDLRDIPAGAAVSAATLSLYAYEQPAKPVSFAVHRAMASWDEGVGSTDCNGRGVSWMHAAPGVTWATEGGDFSSTVEAQASHSGTESPGWDHFALRSLVADWVGGVYPNLGVVVKATDESLVSGKGVFYRSDDYADDPTQRPKLTVTFTDGSKARGPQVDVSTPRAGTAVSGTTDLTVAASDDRRVEQVEFFADGASIGTDATAPYSRAWNSQTVGNGTRTLTAKATDDAGNTTTSSSVSVSVENSNAPATAITSPAATYADTVNADGPAAYWRLGEASGSTAADASGNARPATYAGSVLYGQSSLLAGDANTSVLFKTATTDGRATAALSGLLGSELTAEAWVDYGGGTGAGKRNNVLSRGSGDGSWLLRVYQSSTGSGEVRALWGLTKGTTRTDAVATISPGRHHLAGTYDGATLRLYVDGKLAESAALAGAVPTTSSLVAIGSVVDDDMPIDEAAVYGRTLPASELKTHADVGSGGHTGQVTISATASDDVQVARVEFYVDATRFAEDTAAPWQATLDTLALPVHDGQHTLTTKAYDAHGNVTTSAPVSVGVANAGGSKYQATIDSTAPPQTMAWDPAAAATQEKAGFDVTVANASAATWAAADIVARYRWVAGDGSVVDSGPEVSLGSDLAAGASRKLTNVMVDPPALPDGVDRVEYRLRFDLYEKSAARWFESKGSKPLEHRVGVLRKRPVALGLERYYHYDGAELGAGMQHLVNLASGNSLVRWTPFAATGRGVSTLVNLTYNSLEQHSTSPAGNNMSLSISSLTRFGTRLDVHPNKADEIAGRASSRYVELLDGDGTTHRFTGQQAADGSVYWTEPSGVHLWLRKYSDTDPARAWALTRPDRVTYFFDVDGYPTAVEDGNKNALTFTLVDTPSGEDPGGAKKRITEVTDAGGRKFTVAYYGKADGPKGRVRGKIKRISDHSGSALEFEYYDDGNLQRLTQAGGKNADGSPLASRTLSFTYTEPSSTARATNTSAQSSRIYSVRDPLGRETVFSYLDAGAGADRYKLVSRKDRATKTTSYAYDTTTRTTTLTEPQSASATRTTKFQFDAEGKLTRLTNAKDEVTAVDWTADRHVAKVTPPSSGSEQPYVEFRYDENGYLTDRWDERRRHAELRYVHPSAGSSDPSGDSDVSGRWGTGRTHGHLSDLVTKTDPKGTATTGGGDYEWTFVNDARGNVTSAKDPEQKTTTFEYSPTNGDLTKTTDANGNMTLLESYDPSGQPGKVRAIGKSEGSDDRTTQLGYDADGLLRWIQGPLHAGLTGGDPVDYRTYFSYDEFHRMGRQSTPKSYAHERGTVLYTDTEYDANDNVKAQIAPHVGPNAAAGSRTTYEYDAMDRPTAAIAPPDEPGAPAARSEISYDEAGRAHKMTSPRGVASAGSGLDHATFLGYDELDRVIRSTRYDMSTATPTALVERHCYDTAGDLISVTAPKANPDALTCPVSAGTNYTHRATYFPDHRLKSFSAPLGRTVYYTYDGNGDVETVVDPNGKTTRRFYDQRRMPVKVEEPFSATRTLTTKLEYDAVGNLLRHISPRAWDAGNGQSFANFVTRYEYNDFGEVSRIVLPDDGSTEQAYVHRAYDAAGNLTSVSQPVKEATAPTNATKRTTLSHYDTGWIRTSQHPGDPEVRFDYTPEGWQERRVPQIAAGGEDVFRRVLRSYFPDGTLKQETDRRGQVTQYSYDLNNNLTGAVDSSGIVQKGQVPVEIVAEYDSLDRPTKIKNRRPKDASDTDWRVTSYEGYDAHGNVVDLVQNRVERADGTQVQLGRKLQYAYNQADEPISLIDHGKDSAPTATADDRKVQNAYNQTGLTESRSVTKGAGFVDTLQTTAWTYFDNGLIKTLNTRNGANVLVESHTIDYLDGSTYLNGNPARDTFTLRGPKSTAPCRQSSCTTTWTYDARERATAEARQRASLRTSHYKLDEAGNVVESWVNDEPRAKFDYVGNRLDVQRDDDGEIVARYFYDAAGRLRCTTEAQASKTDCDNYAGHSPFAGLLEYNAYDYQDRLLAHKKFDAAGRRERETTYDYDALDRPVKQIERHGSTGTGSGSRTTELTYLGLSTNVTLEKHDPLSTTGKQRVKSYSYDPFGQRVALNDTVPASGGNPPKSRDFTYAMSPHGSVSLLLNDDGQTQAAYSYTSYGNADKTEPEADRLTHEVDPDAIDGAETADNDPLNAYRYTGKREDTGSGTLDMGARRFSPSTAHFLQQDFYDDALADLGLSTDGLTGNRYALAGGNPVSFVEPDGHEPNTSYDRNSTQPMQNSDGSCLRCDAASKAPQVDGDDGLKDGPDQHYQRGNPEGEPEAGGSPTHRTGARVGNYLADLPWPCQSCDSPRVKNRRLAEGRARMGAIGDAISCAVSEASIGAVDLGGDKQSTGCKAGTIGAMLNPKGLTQHIIKRFGRGGAKGARPLSETDIGLTTERILDGAVPRKVSKSLHFDRAGGFGQANADFDALARGVDVVDRGRGLRTATLSNGTKINVRPFSGGRQPTLEIDTPGNPVIKVRY